MMVRFSRWLLPAFVLFGALVWTGCDDEETEMNNPCEISFDQAALFANYADNLIIPIYTDFGSAVNNMQTAIEAFVADPSTANLETAQQEFAGAYLAYQRTAVAAFGPAEQVFWRTSLNNFPVNTGQVEFNVENGGYDLDQFDTFDKGLPALDYLLHGLDSDPEGIVVKYTTDPLASGYRQYLQDVTNHLLDQVNPVVSAWVSGSYRDEFVANTGTAAGTALSLIINSLNENYETIKRDKIGFPSGVLTLDFPNPEAVEAVYSGLSASLAREAIVTTGSFYRGQSWESGEEGLGLDDYLAAAEATKDGQPLDALIEAQFDIALMSLTDLGDSLEEAADNQTEAFQEAYRDIEKQVLYLKTDLPSVLCVAITYIDNPSDSD